jgi:peroxiredoxin
MKPPVPLSILKWIGYLMAAMVIAFAASVCAAAETGGPSIVILPDARALLDQVRTAYAGLKTLQVGGTITGHMDIDGEKRDLNAAIVGSYDGSRFRSEVKDDALVGNTGDHVYIFMPKSNAYLMLDTPADRLRLDGIDDDIAEVICRQDFSLALALSADAAAEIIGGAQSVTKIGDVTIDNALCPTLKIATESADMTFSFDPHTHLLRRQTVDETRQAQSQGAQSVKAALLVMDFVNTTDAPVDAAQFAWTPPPGAQPIRNGPLEGKPVPDFSAVGMDGATVSADDLKGSVCVLNFFSTQVALCATSLAETDQLAADFKDAGLKAYAVDQSEAKETVAKFIADKGIQTPVLLDPGADVGTAFSVQSFPTVVIVDKQGIVRKTYVGTGHTGQVHAEIERLLRD